MNEYHFPLTAGGIGDKFMILSMILNHRNKFYSDSILNLYTESTSTHKLDIAFDNNEWIINNKNGYLFENKDYSNLGRKILAAIKNKEKSLKLGKQGRKIILYKNSYHKQMNKVLNIYEDQI